MSVWYNRRRSFSFILNPRITNKMKESKKQKKFKKEKDNTSMCFFLVCLFCIDCKRLTQRSKDLDISFIGFYEDLKKKKKEYDSLKSTKMLTPWKQFIENDCEKKKGRFPFISKIYLYLFMFYISLVLGESFSTFSFLWPNFVVKRI